MIIVGIDPGSQFLGYGVIELSGTRFIHREHGVIKLNPKQTLPDKLNSIHKALTSLFIQYKPQFLSLEDIFLGKNPKSSFVLGHVRGVCMLVGHQHKCEVVEYPARKVKKIVTGSGAATKEHLKLIVSNEFKIKTLASMDATDALGVALAHARIIGISHIGIQPERSPQL